MYCEDCGQRISKKGKFCKHCGSKIEHEESVEKKVKQRKETSQAPIKKETHETEKEHPKKRKPIKTIVILLIIAAIAYGAAYIYSLSNIEVVDARFGGFTDASLSGFSFDTEILLKNNGIVPVTINGITYRVILMHDRSQIASGSSAARKIGPGQTRTVTIHTTSNWVPTTELAFRMLTPSGTIARVSGKVHVANFFDVLIIDVPFSYQFDLEAYIKQFIKDVVRETAQRAAQNVRDTATGIVEGIAKVGESVVKGFKSIFD